MWKKIHVKKFNNTGVSKRMRTVNFIFVISAGDIISHKNINEHLITIMSSSFQQRRFFFFASSHRIPDITIPPTPLGINVSHCWRSSLSKGANLQIIGKYNKFINTSILIKNSVMFPLMSGLFLLVLSSAFNLNSPTAQENLVNGGVKGAWTSLTYLSGRQQWWRCTFKHRLALQISTKKFQLQHPRALLTERKLW